MTYKKNPIELLLATLELTAPAPLVNVLCVVHPNEERIGSYPMGRKMNRFQGEINDHILHKKMPNFQICSSNKKILPKVDWQFLGYRKARSFMYIIGETISSSDRNFWNIRISIVVVCWAVFINKSGLEWRAYICGVL